MRGIARRALALIVLAVALPAGAVEPVTVARDLDAERAAAIAAVLPCYVMIAGGSGVVIAPDGLMVTNHHVIDAGYDKGRREFRLRVGERLRSARVLGTDPRGDVSLLRIELAEGETLPHVELADSDRLEVGQQVIALGNPFGAMELTGDPSVTLGIVSLLHRNNGTYSDAIMTDAPVNPGNSGGPLLTMDGKLAGINGRIASKTGSRANTGIGMAIPANQIARFLPLLTAAEGGVVLHGRLRGLSFDTAEADGLHNGAEIAAVTPDSAAATAGLRAGDRIVAAGGQAVRNNVRLRGILGTYPADSLVELVYVRDGKPATTTARLDPIDPGVLGVKADLPEDRGRLRKLLRQLQKNPQVERPVVIAELPPRWPAARSGLAVGDRLVSLGGMPVPNFLHFVRAQRVLLARERFFAGDSVDVVVLRGEGEHVEEHAFTVVLGSRFDEPPEDEADTADEDGAEEGGSPAIP